MVDRVETADGMLLVSHMSGGQNNLFMALAHQIENSNVDNHLDGVATLLRDKVCCHISSEITKYQSKLIESIKNNIQRYNHLVLPNGLLDDIVCAKAYLQDLKDAAICGGFEVCQAVADIYKARVIVYPDLSDAKTPLVFSASDDCPSETTYRLLCTVKDGCSHFDSLRALPMENHVNCEENWRESVEENSREDVEENSRENLEENSREGVEENLRENLEENSKDESDPPRVETDKTEANGESEENSQRLEQSESSTPGSCYIVETETQPYSKDGLKRKLEEEKQEENPNEENDSVKKQKINEDDIARSAPTPSTSTSSISDSSRVKDVKIRADNIIGTNLISSSDLLKIPRVNPAISGNLNFALQQMMHAGVPLYRPTTPSVMIPGMQQLPDPSIWHALQSQVPNVHMYPHASYNVPTLPQNVLPMGMDMNSPYRTVSHLGMVNPLLTHDAIAQYDAMVKMNMINLELQQQAQAELMQRQVAQYQAIQQFARDQAQQALGAENHHIQQFMGQMQLPLQTEDQLQYLWRAQALAQKAEDPMQQMFEAVQSTSGLGNMRQFAGREHLLENFKYMTQAADPNLIPSYLNGDIANAACIPQMSNYPLNIFNNASLETAMKSVTEQEKDVRNISEHNLKENSVPKGVTGYNFDIFNYSSNSATEAVQSFSSADDSIKDLPVLSEIGEDIGSGPTEAVVSKTIHANKSPMTRQLLTNALFVKQLTKDLSTAWNNNQIPSEWIPTPTPEPLRLMTFSLGYRILSNHILQELNKVTSSCTVFKEFFHTKRILHEQINMIRSTLSRLWSERICVYGLSLSIASKLELLDIQSLIEILKQLNTPNFLINRINTYCMTELSGCIVRGKYTVTKKKLQIMKQDCALSARLVTLAIQFALVTAARNCRRFRVRPGLPPELPTLMVYGNDVLVLSENRQDIEDLLKELCPYLGIIGLPINMEASTITIRDPQDPKRCSNRRTLSVGSFEFPLSTSLKYLGFSL